MRAAMLEAGVDAAEASRLVYQERSAAALALEARAVSRITLENGGRVAWSYLTDADFTETGARLEEAELLPDALRALGGIEVVCLLRGDDGSVRGNLRAKTGFDVGSVARTLGGGGHAAAAGFTAQGSVETVLPRLLAMLPGGE